MVLLNCIRVNIYYSFKVKLAGCRPKVVTIYHFIIIYFNEFGFVAKYVVTLYCMFIYSRRIHVKKQFVYWAVLQLYAS